MRLFARMPTELLNEGLVAALGRLWSGVVAIDRTRKAKFLSALLRPFEDASCLAAQGAHKRVRAYVCMCDCLCVYLGVWVHACVCLCVRRMHSAYLLIKPIPIIPLLLN